MARWFVDRSPQKGIPSVSLRRLLPDAKFPGCRDLHVSGCTTDSRRLDPGQVFVAVKGARHDGHSFVGRALDRGAAAVVVERPCPEAGRLQVVVPDSRRALARLCHALAGDPAENLRLVGVTGASGKTSTALFLRSIFEAHGARFGLIGPLGWSDGVAVHPAGAAAGGPEALAEMLAAMVERQYKGGVIEVPPEALGSGEFQGLGLDAAIVTDLGDARAVEPREDRQERRTRAARLFRMVKPGGAAVVNADDSDAELLGATNLDAVRVSFGLERPADVSARIERIDARGSRFRLHGFDREATVSIRLIGSRNVSHALAAAALARSRGVAIDAVVAGLEAVQDVPGRLVPVAEGQDFTVWIDRARTAGELRRALAALRELNPARLHLVVGAEGRGDRAGRLALARAAEAGADRVILTGDNPRDEPPDQILDDLLGGFRRPGRVEVEPDRRRALESALALAAPGDCVLIAGKGDRPVQILADRVVPFDDHALASRWLRHRASPSRRRSA